MPRGFAPKRNVFGRDYERLPDSQKRSVAFGLIAPDTKKHQKGEQGGSTTNKYVVPLLSFDASSLKENVFAVFYGKRRSGKSRCMDVFMSHYKNVGMAYSVAVTDDANGFWARRVPWCYARSRYDVDDIEEMWMTHLNFAKECMAKGMPAPTLAVIFDDCMYAKKIFNTSPVIREMVMNGRHYGLTLCVAAQYMNEVVKGIRQNADYVFLYKQKDETVIYDYWKNYGTDLPWPAFEATFKHYTRRGYCIFIDTTEDGERSIMKFKLPTRLPKYVLGSEDVWEFAYQLERKKRMRRITTNPLLITDMRQHEQLYGYVPMDILSREIQKKRKQRESRSESLTRGPANAPRKRKT